MEICRQSSTNSECVKRCSFTTRPATWPKVLSKYAIGKNLAVTQLRIAEKLNGIFRKTDRKSRTSQMGRDLQFLLEEALTNFGKSIEIGCGVQSPDWTAQLKEKHQ